MADKFIQHDSVGGFREVEAADAGGAGNEGKVVALDSTGRLDATMMPTGVGAETVNVPAFGALANGDFVNVFNDAGTMKARKADASSAVAPANGFVLADVNSGETATVYWSGLNGNLSGLTPGPMYLSTTPGTATHIAPSTAGNIVQKLGTAVNDTVVNFDPKEPILLA